MPNLPAPARACKRFVPAVEAMEPKLALNAPGGMPLQPDPFPPMRPPVLLDPPVEEIIRRESNDLLRQMWERDMMSPMHVPLPDFPPPAPPVEEPEGFWDYFFRTIGEMNDVVPNPGSIY
jgi:hypothetical protein